MPFQKIITEKLSSSVTLQIEKLILRGILRPGDRLPAERELAERFGVSRPSLREAIANLDTRGLLVSKQMQEYLLLMYLATLSHLL